MKDLRICARHTTIFLTAMVVFSLAAPTFAQPLKNPQDDADARYRMGLDLIKKADYARALHELSITASLKKGDDKGEARVYDAEGIAYYKQGLNIEAQGEFGKALSKAPGDIDALYYIGLINYKVNGYTAASRYFNEIIAAGGKDAKVRDSLFRKFFNLGIDFQNRGKSSSAAEMFGEALGLKPDDPKTHFYRGQDYMALERYGDAVSEFRKALALKPDSTKTKAQLEASKKLAAEDAVKDAKSVLGKGEYYSALKFYKQAASYDPSNADAKKGTAKSSSLLAARTREECSKVKALIEKGDFADAKDALAALKKQNPDSDEAKSLSVELAAKSAQAINDLFSKAKKAEDAEALSRAEEFYFRILLIEPSNKKAANNERLMSGKISDEWKKAKAAEAEGNLALAEKRLEKLAVYTPDDPVVKVDLKRIMSGIRDKQSHKR